MVELALGLGPAPLGQVKQLVGLGPFGVAKPGLDGRSSILGRDAEEDKLVSHVGGHRFRLSGVSERLEGGAKLVGWRKPFCIGHGSTIACASRARRCPRRAASGIVVWMSR